MSVSPGSSGDTAGVLVEVYTGLELAPVLALVD